MSQGSVLGNGALISLIPNPTLRPGDESVADFIDLKESVTMQSLNPRFHLTAKPPLDFSPPELGLFASGNIGMMLLKLL